MATTHEPCRLLVAGDVHGNRRWIGTMCKLARRHGCDAVLQLGDFGYWPHVPDGQSFLKHVALHGERNEVTVYWIDGNHENHGALAELRPDSDGTVEINDRWRYLPRGHRWSWRGVRFGALGGGFSIDWRERTPDYSWWHEEVTTAADVSRLGEQPLDVLVAHDAPAGVPLRGLRLPPDDEVRAIEVRELVAEAVRRSRPSLVLHGHWHHKHSY